MFSAPGEKGVNFIDAVCFLMKASDARLTAEQKYIFMSIQSLFGKDIEKNILIVITFADGKHPSVLASVEDAKLPYGFWFAFNNSGLFASNQQGHSCLGPMFWEMGIRNFQTFFDNLEKMKPKSLQQTQQVLLERDFLEATLQKLQPLVDAGLNKALLLKQEKGILFKYETDIQENANFADHVEETRQVITKLPFGQNTTNCLHCNITCHENCSRANDNEKYNCSKMQNGFCTVCRRKCVWSQHANVPFIFSNKTLYIKKINEEKMKRFQEAVEAKLSYEVFLKQQTAELENLMKSVQILVNQMDKCNNNLKKNALYHDPLMMVEYIDLMIESEKLEMKCGFFNRIQVLQTYRKKADISKDVARFQETFKAALYY